MNRIKIVMGEGDMADFIKGLLCLYSNSSWHKDTTDSNLTISFKGDYRTVQKIIYEWLNIPERKSNFNF